MEEPITPERLIIDQEIVVALKKGFDNPETQIVFSKWLDQIETERTEDSLYDIKVSFRRARVYFDAGFVDKAIADLEETLDGAIGELGEGDAFVAEIQKFLTEMKTQNNM